MAIKMHVRRLKLTKFSGVVPTGPIKQGAGMTGKARSKGKERRGKGNDRRYDGRRGERYGGFAPLLLGGGIDATVHIARKPAIRLTHWR